MAVRHQRATLQLELGLPRSRLSSGPAAIGPPGRLESSPAC
jgi:hypothetical protein